MLRELPGYGINSIALVPYGFADRRRVRIFFEDQLTGAVGITRLVQQAHRQAMRVLLKPQLWLEDGYAGSLRPATAAQAEAWFAQYEPFLLYYGRLAQATRCDLLCVGVELAGLTPYAEQWRRLIRSVRQTYSGPLLYGANPGADFEQLQFWDALDYVGLDEYYALPDNLDGSALVAKFEAVWRRAQRPVIFTEAGFASSLNCNRQPWDDSSNVTALEAQARCYEAIFRAFYHLPWIAGMYWWKVGSNGFGSLRDTSHTPWHKPAMDVVAKWYLHGGR
jgi:hypothetical protein